MAIAVVFSDTGARIYSGINPADYKHTPNCLIDPSFPRGVPPHHWKIVGGEITEMSDSEKTDRNSKLKVKVTKVLIPQPKPQWRWGSWIQLVAVAALSSAITYLLIHGRFL